MKRHAICVLVACLGLCVEANGQSGIIATVAGNGNQGFSGNGGLATAEPVTPDGVAVDAAGNLLIADPYSNRVRKVSASGIITTAVGNGYGLFTGDGGFATSASVNPVGIAVDASGSLFVVDGENNRIRKISAAGIITTVAGNGIQGFAGDGPATSASLSCPPGDGCGVAVDASGNLFIADIGNNRIRKVSAGGIITTVAGNGTQGFSGDGGPATSAALNDAVAVAVDASGNLFIADSYNHRIRKVSASGIITTFAGTGKQIFSGDGGPAASASVSYPGGIAVIELFAGGLGPTNPAVAAGQAFSGAAAVASPVTLGINNVNVTPAFAGLSGAGLYQINLTVPSGIGTGDVSLVATVAGAQTPAGVVISLQ